MQRGRFIFWLAVLSATSVGAWQWFIGKALDNFVSARGGLLDRATAVLKMLGPWQQTILGISAGLLIAVLIGYWSRIRLWVREWLESRELSGAGWGPFGLVDSGEFYFAAGQTTHHIPKEAGVHVVSITCHPKSAASGSLVANTIFFDRKHDSSSEQKITYEIWGRRYS